MMGLDEARSALAARVDALEACDLRPVDAAGLRLADTVAAEVDLPPADVSAMDGYAVRASDTGRGVLPVAFEIPAGHVPPPLPPGSAARIFTGAGLPAGADTVVMQEDATLLGAREVSLPRTPPGRNVRRRGGVFASGRRLAGAGDLLTPQRLGLLVAAGVRRVRAVPRPRLAILGTGAELAAEDEAPAPGKIHDSNGPMLAALAEEARLPLAGRGRAGDELGDLVEALRRLGEADLVVSTGGVSVGNHDLVPRAVAELGGEVVLHRVRVQPGKPILVARLGKSWVVGLPGNPVSALVGWWMFVRPLAEALAGDGEAFRDNALLARLDAPFRHTGDRTFLRPSLLSEEEGGTNVQVLPWQGSHDLSAAGPANALARFEPGQDLGAGATVPCYPLGWGGRA
jgi:molybdopterin molybdotransferase